MNAAPLSGLTVIDAASLVAGPMIATYLGEYGANVIKVEQPGPGDAIRKWGVTKNGINLMWKSLGRNKRTATLNLRKPAGQQLFKELVSHADIVIMNSRPSALQKWGLTYDALAEVNPRLIMVHVTGYGAGGPNSDKPGFGTVGEAMSGFAHITGEPDAAPTLPGFMLADCTTAVHGAFAAMVAVHHRDKTGRGQLIDLSLVEPLARFVEQATLTFDQLGTSPGRTGNKWPISAPRNAYETLDGKWIALSGSAQELALRVFDAIGRPELREDPEFSDPERRVANRNEVDDMVDTWVRAHTLEEAMQRFDLHQVAAGPVYNAEQLMSDPQMIARNTFVAVPDDDLGEMRVQAPVARMSDSPGQIEHLGRGLGADNHYVYGDVLGLTPDEIDALRHDDII